MPRKINSDQFAQTEVLFNNRKRVNTGKVYKKGMFKSNFDDRHIVLQAIRVPY